jgi:glycosyltransferase involved in cell wall biosynthesis
MVDSSIIYVCTHYSSFVLKDIAILKTRFKVEVIQTNLSPKWLIPFRLGLVFCKIVFRKRTIVINQFAGFLSVPGILAAKIRKHKVVTVLGGTDCVAFPSIQYGNFNRKMLGKATAYSLLNSDLLLPVDSSLVLSEYTYQPNDFPQQGYKAFVKNINTPFKVIYNGFDPDLFKDLGKKRKKNSFVTIGAKLDSRFGFHLKGIDLLNQLSELLPEIEIHIIGGIGLEAQLKSPNIILHPTIPNHKLVEVLNEYEFYMQLSMSEGFPNALCEAMLCGCIPIVSNVAAMPKIVGDIGGVLKKKDIKLLKTLVESLINLDNKDKEVLSKRSRQQIIDNYPLTLREYEFLKSIEDLRT